MTSPQRQRHLIRVAHRRAGLSVDELWLRYFAMGGTVAPLELDAYLNEMLDLPAVERDRLAMAVNEHLDGLVGPRAPYAHGLRAPEARAGTLGALVELLQRTHLAPPDALPAAVAAASRHLRVRTVVYLADDAKEVLVPVPGPGAEDRRPLSIDGTLPGRAFRHLEIQPAPAGSDGQARLWVPLIDGVERIGVLDVMTDADQDLTDPVLHRQCWWFGHYLGHLVTAMDAYGDALDPVRRNHRRSVQSELIWQLLPPLTAGTDKVLVSGRIEPSHDMGGDVFDYALSADRAQFAILDATGHDLRAGLAAATAVSAYRNARRAGAGLFEQVEAAHRAVSEQFDGQVYATGVVGELDLTSGRLRYIAAGHPAPLLVRDGRVVRSLEAGRRPLLGLDVRGTTIGEEHLQRGDTVALYTDGITEARDTAHQQFGVDRLTDTLQRAHAERLPLPEITRRVFKAILSHQHDVLQDDATLLLVRWTTEGQAALDPVPVD